MSNKEATEHLLMILRHRGVISEKDVTEVTVRLSD